MPALASNLGGWIVRSPGMHVSLTRVYHFLSLNLVRAIPLVKKDGNMKSISSEKYLSWISMGIFHCYACWNTVSHHPHQAAEGQSAAAPSGRRSLTTVCQVLSAAQRLLLSALTVEKLEWCGVWKLVTKVFQDWLYVLMCSDAPSLPRQSHADLQQGNIRYFCPSAKLKSSHASTYGIP